MENTIEKKIGYRDLKTQKQYLKLILANIVNRFGDSIDAIAFTWLVYKISGSATWCAMIFGINYIPTIIFQPILGALVEEIEKKKLMAICDFIRGLLVSVIAILFIFNALTPWYLLIVTFLNSSVEALRVPAGIAVTPLLLEEKYYEFGVGLNTTISRIVEIVGLAVAGGIIGVLGVEIAIFTDAVTFFISGIIIFTIRVRENILKERFMNLKKYLENLKGGFSYIAKTKIILEVCMMGAFLNTLFVPLNSLQAPLVSTVYNLGAEVLSVLGIAITVGLTVGSFIYPYVSKKVKGKTIVYLGILFSGLSYITLMLLGKITGNLMWFYILLCISQFIFGLVSALMLTCINVSFMRKVDQQYMARVGGAFNACVGASTPAMSFIISICVAKVSVDYLFVIFGILSIILSLIIVLGKGLREL